MMMCCLYLLWGAKFTEGLSSQRSFRSTPFGGWLHQGCGFQTQTEHGEGEKMSLTRHGTLNEWLWLKDSLLDWSELSQNWASVEDSLHRSILPPPLFHKCQTHLAVCMYFPFFLALIPLSFIPNKSHTLLISHWFLRLPKQTELNNWVKSVFFSLKSSPGLENHVGFYRTLTLSSTDMWISINH